jgi:hypothetical protein
MASTLSATPHRTTNFGLIIRILCVSRRFGNYIYACVQVTVTALAEIIIIFILVKLKGLGKTR